MQQFAHDNIVPNTQSQLPKKKQVANMFNNIAHKYDFINRFLSLGIDIGWRKKAIKQLQTVNPTNILDVATGTGDMAIFTYNLLQPKPKSITGIDISTQMLACGVEKIKEKGLENIIHLAEGDSENLQFDNDSFDAVTVTFGVRNFENLTKGLSEIRRVLKPGGKLVVLEFSQPKRNGFHLLYRFYMNQIAPAVGKIFAGDAQAYRYLNKSAKAFPEGSNFINILHEVGFTHTYLQTLSLGICTIYCGSK